MRHERTAGSLCIYCGQTAQPPSWEHIVPAAIGGTFEAAGLLCGACNNAFSSKTYDDIDKELADQLADQLSVLNLRTGRKRKPRAVKGVASVDGVEFDFGPGLRLQPGKRAKSTTYLGDGVLEHRRVVRNEDVEAELAKIQEKYGAQVGSIRQTPFVPSAAPEPSFRVELGGVLGHRAVAKMAFNFLGCYFGGEPGLSPVFAAVREWIRLGTGEVRAGFDHVNPFHSGELQVSEHRITVATDDTGKRVIGYVTLYGGLRFSVLLATGFSGAAFGRDLVCEAGRGIRQVELQERLPYDFSVVADHMSHWEANRDGNVAALKAIMRQATQTEPPPVDLAKQAEAKELLIDAYMASGGPDLIHMAAALDMACAAQGTQRQDGDLERLIAQLDELKG